MPKSTEYAAKVADDRGFIAYDAEEDAVWRDLMAQQLPAVRDRMASPYLRGLDLLDLPQVRVPQCPEVSAKLGALTGWRVEPVPALIGFGRFFGMLADRTFPAASFIRKRKHFNYIEEPDIFHEIFGHTPLLTDPAFAAFSQAIGAAGTRCDKADYAWLIRLYWFSIEFGLMREDGLAARRRRKFVRTTDSNHSEPVAPNLLARHFEHRKQVAADLLIFGHHLCHTAG